MRFALLQIKLTVIKILKNYKITPSKNTPLKDEYRKLFQEKIVIRKAKVPLMVKFSRRSN
jgi:hypothetical protein